MGEITPSGQDWDRWRGRVDVTLETIVRDVKTITSYVEDQKQLDAAEAGRAAARKEQRKTTTHRWEFIAPNLPAMLALGISVFALVRHS